jgi:hypothetical protein
MTSADLMGHGHDAVHPDIAPGIQYEMKPPYEPEPPLAWTLEWATQPSKMVTFKALKILKRIEGEHSEHD